MIERDSGHAEKQNDGQAEHREIDVQPAHQLGESNIELAAHREGCRVVGVEPDHYFASSLAAILDRGGLDLDIPLEVLAERFAIEKHDFANALIRSVLASGFDGDGVFAAGELFAVVVLAVPDDLVLARRAGRAARR